MKYIRNFFLFLFCILLSAYLILQIPSVKSFTIKKSIEFVNNNADFHISYQNFSYKDLKDISFTHIVINDKKNKKELLKVQQLQVGLNIFNLFFKKELNLKNLDFVDLVVFIDKNSFLNSDTEQKNLNYFNSFRVKIENLNFSNCSVFFDNNDIPKNTKLFFDHNHFNVSKINSHLENVIFSKKGISGGVKNFNAESGNILFKDLSLNVKYYDKLSLQNISLDSNLGKLSGNCEIFNFENLDYTLDLQNLILYSNKIPFLEKLNSEISLEGSAKGNIHESCIQKLRLRYNKNTASFSGDINFDKSTYDLKNISGKFHLQTLKEIIPAEIIKNIPCQIGTFNGKLKGEGEKGNIIFNIHSKEGDFSSNFDFDNIFSKNRKVDGNVSLKNVDIKDFNITKLNSDHKITFSPEEIKIDNKISKVNYNNVEINNIDLKLQGDNNNYYSGLCNIDDKDLKTNLKFKNYDHDIIFLGNINLRNLNKFYGGEKKIDIKNEVRVKVKKDKIRANFNNNSIKIDDVNLNLKSLQTNFYKEDKFSQFNIFSDILDLKVYDIPENGHVFKDIFLQFLDNLNNWVENKPLKISKDPNFKIPFYIHVKDNNIFQLFKQSIIIDYVNIYGDFVHANGKKFFNLNVDKIENIKIQDHNLNNTNLGIKIGLDENKKLPIIDLTCEIDKVFYKNFATDNILFQIQSHEKDINTNFSFKNNYVTFNWDVKSFFDKGKIILDLQNEDSQCTLNDWKMEKKGCIKLTNKNISVENLTLGKNKMFLVCDYDLSRQGNRWDDKFFFQIKNIDIGNWNEYIEYDIKGILNGEIKKNYASFLDINFNVDELMLNNKSFGSLVLMTKYDTNNHIYRYNLLGKKEDKVNLDVNGLFFETNGKINAQCLFYDFDVNIFDVFCKPVCKNLEGLLFGHINVFGNISQPIFWGDVEMKDGKVLFIPINTEYNISGHFRGDNDGFNITNLSLQDKEGGKADFNGKIKINFQDYPELYLQGIANEIQVLHTTEKDNKTFYGNLFGSGNIKFTGPVNFLTISGNVKNKKQSKISLNFRNDDIKTYNFIHFKDKDEKLLINKPNIDTKLNGIRLNLDTTFDNELLTSVKIPFSEINIQGDGKLHVLTTFNDDFDFKGNVSIDKGNYLLSIGEIINKKFKIEKGGSLNFLGDISSATLDITASEEIILNDSNENIVTLKVTTSGLIQDPEIKYDIDLSKSKNVNADIKNKIASSEDMRNYYFLNLLLFRNFESSSVNISTDIFNFFNKTINISNEKRKFGINLNSDQFLAKKLFKVDLSFTYDKYEISKGISNKKQDFKNLIFDDIEMLYSINKDSKLYTSVKKNKIKFGFKRGN